MSGHVRTWRGFKDVVKKINDNFREGDICNRQWTKGCQMTRYYGNERPAELPSIFENIHQPIVSHPWPGVAGHPQPPLATSLMKTGKITFLRIPKQTIEKTLDIH